MTGLPNAAIFAHSQYMVTGSPPISETQTEWYDKIHPLILTKESVIGYDPKAMAPSAKVSVALQHWSVVKQDVAAFASVITDDNHAWGAVANGQSQSQDEVDKQAISLCAKYAADKGIDKPCELYKPIKK